MLAAVDSTAIFLRSSLALQSHLEDTQRGMMIGEMLLELIGKGENDQLTESMHSHLAARGLTNSQLISKKLWRRIRMQSLSYLMMKRLSRLKGLCRLMGLGRLMGHDRLEELDWLKEFRRSKVLDW